MSWYKQTNNNQPTNQPKRKYIYIMSKLTIEALTLAIATAEANIDTLTSAVATAEAIDPADKAAVKLAKTDLKKGNTVLKNAIKALAKGEATALALQETEQKAADKQQADEDKKQAVIAKAAAKEAAKEEKAAAKEAAKMPEQNGIRRPKPGGKCAAVWEICDALSYELQQAVSVKPVIEAAEAAGLNPNMARSNYAVWRKFNGIVGRVTAPVTDVPVEVADVPVEVATPTPADPSCEMPVS
jgi:hypothetical protein